MFIFRWKVGFDLERRGHLNYLHELWDKSLSPSLKFDYNFKLSQHSVNSSDTFRNLIFTTSTTGSRVIYTHSTHYYHSMPETVEHKKIRLKISEDNEEDVLTVCDCFDFLCFFKSLTHGFFFL